MGGYGSGRQLGRDTTSQYQVLDVRQIRLPVGTDHVLLSYRRQSGEKSTEYPVYLDWTGCNLGGRQAWFLCPARGCGRRVAILYGGSIFACRHCHKLAYPSQREPADDRALRRAERIRARLGWELGIANPGSGKPKFMHWRTYQRLKAEHDAFAEAALAGMARRLA